MIWAGPSFGDQAEPTPLYLHDQGLTAGLPGARIMAVFVQFSDSHDPSKQKHPQDR